MAEEEEVVVTIDPAADNATGDSITEDPAKVLAQQWDDLKADNEREKERARKAEASARQARAEADSARREATTSVIESQYDTVVQGLAAADAEASQAEQEYAAAFEKGDGAAMAKAQRKIAAAEARKLRFDEAKDELEIRRKEPQRQQQRTEREPQREAIDDDPLEAYVRGRSAPTQKWLRAHPEWVTDSRKNTKLTAAHMDAMAEGLSVDTKDYFEHIESFIGLRKQNGNGHDTSAATPARRKSSVPAAAPVHQSGGGMNGGNGREVRLTPGEARSATDGTLVWNYDDPSGQKKFKKGDVIGIQEMARRKLDGQRRGVYDRSYTES